MVTADIKAAVSSPKASHHPHNIIHTTLPIKLIDLPVSVSGLSIIFLPNGQKEKTAILKDAMPNGIPIMVIKEIIAASVQPKPIKNPPNTNQIILPNSRIRDILGYQVNCFII